MTDEIRVIIRFQCDMNFQSDCSGYIWSEVYDRCAFGEFEKLCYNESLKQIYFLGECNKRFAGTGENCKHERCENEKHKTEDRSDKVSCNLADGEGLHSNCKRQS
jgi:hypothetical protein